MSLAAGTRLGPYEILAPIGSGGMCDVYRARDTRLNRTVAVKVSQDRFSERFEQEAHAVAALNHPNICQLYDVGPNYLVMEFIEGTPVGRVNSPRKLLDPAMLRCGYGTTPPDRRSARHPGRRMATGSPRSFLTSVRKLKTQIYLMKNVDRPVRLADQWFKR